MIAQEQEGWVTKASIEHIAEMLDMPYIRVLEVATFYTQFMLAPVGTKAHVQVCGTTPCMLRGSEDLMKVCREKIHSEQFHTNEEGTLSWEEVECQGACVNAPMVMIFRDTYEDLTSERLAEIIDEFEAGRGERVTAGPQVDRTYSAPEGGLTALTSEVLVKGSVSAAAKSHSEKGRTRADQGRQAQNGNEEGKRCYQVTGETCRSKWCRAGSPEKTRRKGGRSETDLRRRAKTGKNAQRSRLLAFPARSLAGPARTSPIVDDQLSFKGRIDRDDWVKQAKALAGNSAKGAK